MIKSLGLDLSKFVERGRQSRDAGKWLDAIACYSAANEIDSGRFDIKHNLALSFFGANRHADAMRFLEQALALKPDLWPSHVLKAKVLRDCGRAEEAGSVLSHILRYDHLNGHALLAAADLEMNEFGDARGARERVMPLLANPAFRAEAELTILMSKLYDRDESDAELSLNLMDFARRELVMPEFVFDQEALSGVQNRSGRCRVGLLSPMFCLSPVYFLTFAAFSMIADTVDLVVFNRGNKVDAGTSEFRRVAVEWHDVQNLDAPALANAMKRQNIDVLFDLGGWSDPIGLKALSSKPAGRMYKWIGGQSATTGLTVFDGFLTDEVQSPPGTETLHTEPLVRLGGGYVSYVPPSYLPRRAAAVSTGSGAIAVAGNPAKVSQRFLERLAQSEAEFVFIDRRYAFGRAVRRIEQALNGKAIFVSPNSHEGYLSEVDKYNKFFDTSPYSSGLTAIELILMGKELISQPGQMVSSRHCQSHLFFGNRGTLCSGDGFVKWGNKIWQS